MIPLILLIGGVLLTNAMSGSDLQRSEAQCPAPPRFKQCEQPRELHENEELLTEASGRFGFDLMHRIAGDDPSSSHIISPVSVIMAYGMMLNGAEGDTYDQISEVLGLEALEPEQINNAAGSLLGLLATRDEHVDFSIANSIWYRNTFDVESVFLETNRRYFDAVIEKTDFDDPATVDRINEWVTNKTEGLIDRIVEPPIDPLTMMYLINAVYFNGEWAVKFDPEHTGPKMFYHADGSKTEVKMMHLQSEENMQYSAGENYRAVNLYYGDAGFAMTLVLPEEKMGLEEWLQQMDWEQWNDLTGSFDRVTLDLEMPKFELEYEVADFVGVLNDLGIVNAFDPELSDFSHINTGYQDLHISDSRHKTFIRVDEEGTEAAAATSTEMGITSISPHEQIRFDRPYFYMIRESDTGTPLFMGTMTNPSD